MENTTHHTSIVFAVVHGINLNTEDPILKRKVNSRTHKITSICLEKGLLCDQNVDVETYLSFGGHLVCKAPYSSMIE